MICCEILPTLKVGPTKLDSLAQLDTGTQSALGLLGLCLAGATFVGFRAINELVGCDEQMRRYTSPDEMAFYPGAHALCCLRFQLCLRPSTRRLKWTYKSTYGTYGKTWATS